MSLPSVLTLIVNRRHGNLSREAIDIARTLVHGAMPEILSENEAVDIPCPTPESSAANIATIRATLAPFRVDAILSKSRGRRKAVLIADMDSTILTGETLDELAALTGTGEEVAAITRLSMNGEMDFDESLRQRTIVLAGQPENRLEEVYQKMVLTDGARELVQTMKAHGARTALISGGFTWFTQRIAPRCGFDEHYGNVLEIRDGIITGQLIGSILGPETKRTHLKRLCEKRGVKIRTSLTTGDGANDIPMLQAAGLGLAFHAKPAVREAIEGQVNFAGLRAHLFAQGYPASAIIGNDT